jgi:hypothetical protein
MTVPVSASLGRSGFGPEFSLAYNSGSGNGVFGFGWSMSLPSVTRKTDKGLQAADQHYKPQPADGNLVAGVMTSPGAAAGTSTIVTSTGQQDAGLFEVNLRRALAAVRGTGRHQHLEPHARPAR